MNNFALNSIMKILSVFCLHQDYNPFHEADRNFIFLKLIAYTQTVIRNQGMIIKRILCPLNTKSIYLFPNGNTEKYGPYVSPFFRCVSPPPDQTDLILRIHNNGINPCFKWNCKALYISPEMINSPSGRSKDQDFLSP